MRAKRRRTCFRSRTHAVIRFLGAGAVDLLDQACSAAQSASAIPPRRGQREHIGRHSLSPQVVATTFAFTGEWVSWSTGQNGPTTKLAREVPWPGPCGRPWPGPAPALPGGPCPPRLWPGPCQPWPGSGLPWNLDKPESVQVGFFSDIGYFGQGAIRPGKPLTSSWSNGRFTTGEDGGVGVIRSPKTHGRGGRMGPTIAAPCLRLGQRHSEEVGLEETLASSR